MVLVFLAFVWKLVTPPLGFMSPCGSWKVSDFFGRPLGSNIESIASLWVAGKRFDAFKYYMCYFFFGPCGNT